MTDYDTLTDSELRTRLSAIGYDLPISINRDFLIRKLQQAEQGSGNATSGTNGTPSTKKRLSLNVPSSSPAPPVANKRPARNSVAVNQNHQPPAPPPASPAVKGQPTATVTPPRTRKHTPPRQPSKPTVPSPPPKVATPPPASKPTQARTTSQTQKISLTRKYVNVDDTDEDNRSAEEAEPVSPPASFISPRKSTSLQVPSFSSNSKSVASTSTTSPDKIMKYMKLFNDNAYDTYKSTAATTYRRSTGGRFSSDDDDDSDSTDRNTFRVRTRHGNRAPSTWHKIKDYITNNVSNVILLTACIVFLLLSVGYFWKSQNSDATIAVADNSGKQSDTYLPLCENGIEDEACIPETHIVDTKKLFQELRTELNERRKLIDCKSPDDELASDNLNIAKTKSLLYRLSAFNKPRIDSTFPYLLHFIIENPKLGLILETELSNGTRQQLTKAEDITFAETDQYNVFITTMSTDRAWYCAIVKTIWSTISYITLVAVVAFVIVLMYQAYTIVLKYQETKKRQLFSLVEDILNLLQEHHENSQLANDDPLAIHHLRDNLIQPSDRTPEKMRLWEAAIEYILTNESRVREEMHHIRGEEYRVLKWLPTVSPKRPNSTGGGWQGQAFEIVDGSPNSLPLKIPTNCLKVRHMYDSKSPLTEELKNKIESSLNSKAGVPLKHIGYDNHNDSCVYLKCGSKEDAKTAYLNLHGWWFDGKLLSVKFLREQRYHTRFPESEKLTNYTHKLKWFRVTFYEF